MAKESHPVLTSAEHCLKRPDTFIGSTVPIETEYFRFVKDDSKYKLEKATITIAPAVAQLFLEVLTNAVDQSMRENTHVKNIKVTMDPNSGKIGIWNDGESIPIRMHNQFPDRYLTTVIFSEFRCGSNFDDTQKRRGAGRNGYGVKCTNTWSKEFTVEHNDGETNFKQTWKNNMSVVHDPVMKKKSRKPFTCVSFILDYERLHVTNIPEVIDYLRSFVWHLCPVTDPKVSVSLDEIKLPIRNLKEYADIICGGTDVIYDSNDRFQIAVCAKTPNAPSMVGYVNSIPCSEGSHMNYVMNEVLKCIGVKNLSSNMFSTHATLLVNVIVDNPTFTSQTKTKLLMKMTNSGASWTPSDSFVRKLKKSEVVNAVKIEQELRETHKARSKASRGTSSHAKNVNVDGYETAKNAGRKNRKTPCTLLVTEGLSAKAFAVAGVHVVGRDDYGIFALRGKPKNVRGLSTKQILEVKEVENILMILGIDTRVPIKSTQDLRYDRVCIMTDQDVDGAHIASLVINFLEFLLPHIIENVPTFVQRFATPLVRVWEKSNKNKLPKEFMSEATFKNWWKNIKDEQSKYEVKYYKGLGTSTARDAKYYFQNIDRYLISIDCTAKDNRELLRLCFSGDESASRRRIMKETKPMEIDYTQNSIPLAEFLKGELVPFWNYSNERAIPSSIDGLKPSQRKILWTLLTAYRTTTSPSIKVAQLSGDVAKRTHYKHGEDSLNGTQINMAQDFPTSGNNLNLLTPGGMFGDRHGNDAASARYIFTCAEPIAHYMFPKEDYPVLDLLEADGASIEPQYMIPVIPFALCNLTTGSMGTGYSCDIPACDPAVLIEWCKAYATNVKRPVITPWLEGFNGPVTEVKEGVWAFDGILTQPKPRHIHVTELGTLTSKFLINRTKKSDVKLWDAWPHKVDIASSDTNIDLTMKFDKEVNEKLLHTLQTRARIYMTSRNMHMWSSENKIHRFKTMEEVAEHHAKIRLQMYEKRRLYQINKLKKDIQRLNEKYRFVVHVMEKPSFIFRKTRHQIVEDLKQEGYQEIDGSYDHLLRLPIVSATQELLDALKKENKSAQAELVKLKSATCESLWIEDLDRLSDSYKQFLKTRKERRCAPEKNGKRASHTKQTPSKKSKRM